MKKKLSLLFVLLLSLSLILAACKKNDKEPSTVSIPMVGQTGGSDGTKADGTYPAKDETKVDVSVTYPVDPNSPTFDEDMKAWIQKLFGDQHTVEFVLSKTKTADEWRAHFNTPEHEHLKLSPTELDILVNWLANRQK